MAISRFSTPFQISRPISVVNEELYDNVMHEKQSAYDEGYLNVQKALQHYNALDLVKPEDVAYRDKKVAELTDKLDGYGNVDLSDPKEVIRLQTEAAGLSKDKELMSMVSSTANYRQWNKRMDMLKENPKLIKYYRASNEYYDRKQINSWLNGESKSLGISSPTLSMDVEGIIGNQLKQQKPTVFSQVNGMYIVDNKILSEGDLSNTTLNSIQGNPEIQAQLMRDADYNFRDYTPEQMYNLALSNKVDMIQEARKSIDRYENQLKDASLNAEQKSDINAKIEQLKTSTIQQEESYRDLTTRYNRGEINDLNSLKYEVYANKWIKSQVTPYIISEQKVRPNQVQIYANKESNTNERFNKQMAFDQEQKRLDRELELQKVNSQNKKIGAGKASYDANGNLVIDNTGVYDTLPALQPDGEVDAYKELNNSVTKINNDSKTIISGYIKKALYETDPTLLSKIAPLLENGNLFNIENGKSVALFDKTGLSKGQIDLLASYDELLDNSINPDFVKNSTLLPEYGKMSNDIAINQMKANTLLAEKAKAMKIVFDNAHARNQFKGSWKEFNDLLNNNPSQKVGKNDVGRKISGTTYDPITGGYVRGSFANTDREKFLNQINAELNKSSVKNSFLTAKVIGEKDEVYNNPENSYKELVESAARKGGIYISGKLNSIDGKINDVESHGENIPNFENISITGIIPNTNQVRVKVSYKNNPDDKESTVKEALVQLSPSQMEQMIGRNSETYDPNENFQNYLVNGQMQDRDGTPMYFNLNATVPDMLGNLQYRVWSLNKGKLRASVKIPTGNGRVEDMMIPGLELEGTNALRDMQTILSQIYINSRQAVIASNPKATKEEIHKATIQEVYKEIQNRKQWR